MKKHTIEKKLYGRIYGVLRRVKQKRKKQRKLFRFGRLIDNGKRQRISGIRKVRRRGDGRETRFWLNAQKHRAMKLHTENKKARY